MINFRDNKRLFIEIFNHPEGDKEKEPGWYWKVVPSIWVKVEDIGPFETQLDAIDDLLDELTDFLLKERTPPVPTIPNTITGDFS